MADNFLFQQTIPFKYWARSADTLYQEVSAPRSPAHAPYTDRHRPALRYKKET